MARSSELITSLEPVRPGDLITASFVNGLIEAFWELEERVVALEAEGTTEPPAPGTGSAPTATLTITFVEATLSRNVVNFEVHGTKLLPAGLKTFSINQKPIRPTQLDGDDDTITFAVASSAIPTTTGTPRGLRDIGRPTNLVLAITNTKGSTAQKRFTVEEGGKL